MLTQPTKEYETKLLEILQEYPKFCVTTLGYLAPADIKDVLIRQAWEQAVAQIGKDTTDYEAANVVSTILINTGILEQGFLYSSLDDITPDSCAKKIQEMAFFRRVDRLNEQIVNAVRVEDAEKVTLLKEQLRDERMGTDGGMKSSLEVHREFEERVSSEVIAIPWRIAGMDNATGGQERQTLSVVASRPGMGKTAFALQACRNSSYKYKAGFFQLEMGATSMWARLACPAVGVNWKDVIAGRINDAKRKELIGASKKLAEQYEDMYIDDTSGLTTSEVYQKTVQNSLDIIYVDHLWLLGDKGDREVDRLGDITMRLKNMAKSLDIPVVLLVQLSRAVESRKDKTPTLRDLRDSGKIEETADNVYMLYRESYYDEDGNDTTELWVRKFRNGEANVRVWMDFDQQQQWFDDPAPSDDIYIPSYIHD